MGVQTVTVNININYRKECRLDDQLTIKTFPEKMGRSSYILKQEIYNQHDELCADALVTSVTMNIKDRKSQEVPEKMKAFFHSL